MCQNGNEKDMEKGGGARMGAGAQRKVPPPIAACGTRVVPEWVKDLRPHGSARAEGIRLGGVKEHSIQYWRLRLRMFSPRSLFGDPARWSTLRESIEDQLSPWEPKPFHVLFPDVRADYGKLSHGDMRHALRMLVEDGVLLFTPQQEDDFGGYTRPPRPARRVVTDLDWDDRDAVTPRDEARAAKRAPHLAVKRACR